MGELAVHTSIYDRVSWLYKSLILTFALVILSCTACSKDEEYIDPTADTEQLPQFENIRLNFRVPSNFPELTYDIESNYPTETGFELGKELFYEGELASDGLIACGFCHIQRFAFTHHTHQVSHGVDGAIGTRNAQPLHNLAWMNEFNWDGAANHLDVQPIIPLTSEVEMNETVGNVVNKLAANVKYQTLFARAFENGKVDAENMFKALSQFMLMMVSANSRYDNYIRKENNIQLTENELEGMELFKTKCSSCHNGELFTDQTYRNNGLPIDPEYNDIGRGRVSGDVEDNYKFRVPTLRNIELSFPYMHDGRFRTLQEVLDFYASGMEDNPTIDSSLRQNTGKLGIPMTEKEKEQIITFLKTLTDTDFASDRRFAEF